MARKRMMQACGFKRFAALVLALLLNLLVDQALAGQGARAGQGAKPLSLRASFVAMRASRAFLEVKGKPVEIQARMIQDAVGRYAASVFQKIDGAVAGQDPEANLLALESELRRLSSVLAAVPEGQRGRVAAYQGLLRSRVLDRIARAVEQAERQWQKGDPGPLPADGRGDADWIDKPEVLSEVEGYAIPGGVLIDGKPGASRTIYLTKHFFEESGIPVPRGVKEVKLWAYRYYKPPGLSRGSGRDHLIAVDSPDPGRRLTAVKGSGSNAHFSKANGVDFKRPDFRRNGLQSVGDDPEQEHGGAVVEYIMAKNFADLGVPVVPHDRLILLPGVLQTKQMHGGEPHFLAVQVERVLEDERESLSGKTPSREEIFRLAGSMLFFNIGHGAVNPENITATAKIIDLGHVTFGYPFTSGIYRCTICRLYHGGSSDGNMISVLDHYFGGGRGSYSHALSKNQATGLLQAVLRNLNSNEFASVLNAGETKALLAATKEELSYAWWYGTRSLGWAQLELLDLNPEAFDRGLYAPAREAVSLRLLMQIAALKSLLGKEAGEQAREKLLSLVTTRKTRTHIVRLLDLFDRLFSEKKATQAQLQILFRERLPASEIQDAVYKEMGEVETLEEAAKVLGSLVRRFGKPVEVDPRRFLEVFLKIRS